MNDRSLRGALGLLVGAVAIGDAMLGPPPAGCVSIGSVRFLAISVLDLMTKAARELFLSAFGGTVLCSRRIPSPYRNAIGPLTFLSDQNRG
jgi:hypothetical protein